VVRTFQNIRLFKDLSVLENVQIAVDARTRGGLWGGLAATRAFFGTESACAAEARGLLERLDLGHRFSEKAGSLPYGEQKRLEIARALGAQPKVLLLDEPAAGMNPSESAWLKTALRRLRADFALSILLIEHDMSVVMDLCERLIVLDHGQKIAEGEPRLVREDARVLEAYLGTKRGKSGGRP
jgi:branched-chain amino acid transport system ATP-binding protein